MGFFDNLGKKASRAYDVTAEKTSKIAKEAKLRMKINENKSDINDIYKEIGKKVYEKHVREENIDIKTELEEECTKIDVLSAEIETCLKTILELKEKKQCENCHAEIDLDNTFCPKCGAKQPEIEVKEAEVVDMENDSQDYDDSEKSNCSECSKENENPSEEIKEESGESNKEGNTVEKVTEVMSVETQENAKQEDESQENQQY